MPGSPTAGRVLPKLLRSAPDGDRRSTHVASYRCAPPPASTFVAHVIATEPSGEAPIPPTTFPSGTSVGQFSSSCAGTPKSRTNEPSAAARTRIDDGGVGSKTYTSVRPVDVSFPTAMSPSEPNVLRDAPNSQSDVERVPGLRLERLQVSMPAP